MSNGSKFLVGAIGLLLAQSTSAQTSQTLSQEQFVRVVDQCLQANAQTEFDTPAEVLGRVRGSCTLTGTVRFPARGHPILGDILIYDATRGRFAWNAHFDEQNLFYGGGASPYRLTVQLDATGRPVSPNYPPEVTAVLREVGNASFWLLPLFRTAQVRDTYRASNAFGASREVMRVRETRYGIAMHVPSGLVSLPVLAVPLDAVTARGVADHLDIALTFRVGEVCRFCYKANTIDRSVQPTIQAPLDQSISTRFVYVEILRMDVTDRRTGQAYPATLAPAQ